LFHLLIVVFLRQRCDGRIETAAAAATANAAFPPPRFAEAAAVAAA
jgi:hypothetical protein